MKKREKYIPDKIDPIQVLIDRQLASLWRGTIYKLIKVGRGNNYMITQGDSTPKNTVEDAFIEAYDRKYHKSEWRKYIIADELADGLTQDDIANKTGWSLRTIKREVKKLKEELS